jgi:hypothetical protein
MERRAADAELSAEVSDCQVSRRLPLDLSAPPFEPRLVIRPPSDLSDLDSSGAAQDAVRRSLHAPPLVWPNGYEMTLNLFSEKTGVPAPAQTPFAFLEDAIDRLDSEERSPSATPENEQTSEESVSECRSGISEPEPRA